MTSALRLMIGLITIRKMKRWGVIVCLAAIAGAQAYRQLAQDRSEWRALGEAYVQQWTSFG
ncbi:hypothetical protein MSG28_005506 [Choristoneura fumiferana]|uniref:Uncharacterized protein n=1 Tax=Choristoneura fumiferana TaxID=7141 RepID=A0ACC0KZR2_CHOFU|nr:hypothetical protein MSG28_005506 [Choristoneura fumiferana]